MNYMKYKSIPETIKIGPQKYDIEFVDSGVMDNNAGKVLWSKRKIWLDDEIPESIAQETLLHEILHCIHYMTKFSKSLPDDDDEKAEELIIERIDSVLLQVLKENKLRF